MKHILLLLMTFLGSARVFAQEKVIIDEPFDNADKGWFIAPKDDNFQTKVNDGLYILKVKDKTSSYWSHLKTELSPNEENFYVESTLECTKGEVDRGFGLLLGMYADNSSYVSFLITNNGYFKIAHYYSSQDHIVSDWKVSSAIRQKQPNKLSVKREYNCVYFYINDVLVHHVCNITWWGSKFGFTVGKEQTVQVDHFKLTATPKVVHPVGNAIQGRKKENLGDAINSAAEEIAPMISYDGKTLYFVRSDHPGNTGSDKSRDDVWLSRLDSNGNWSTAQNIGKPINNAGANSIKSIAPDNNSCMISNTYNTDGSSAGEGISISRMTSNGWELPQKVVIRNFKNSNRYFDFFRTADNKTLLLALENEQTLGDMDLYVSFLQEDNSFSEPKNLGSIINTPGAEFGMSLASDGKTMYFNSYGHESYGSADVFITKRLDDSWTNWSKPQNLGPEINSESWEGTLCISASGEFAYLSTMDNSKGKADICRIRMTKESKPEPVVLVYGKVLNKKSNEPLGTTITYNNLKDNQQIGIANSNPGDGSYRIILPLGKAYSFLAEKSGFYSVSDNMDVTSLGEYREIERNLYLAPLEEGTTILLNNIFFEFDKSALMAESYSELDRLLKILKDNPQLKIEIAGHTDDKGSDEYNRTLSQSRVNSVVAYLTVKGVESSRLIPKGYGESKPLVENNSDDNRARNRRVEFTILKN